MSVWVAVGIGLVAMLVGVLSSRRLLAVIYVEGDSMLPTFVPGDRVLILRRPAARRPRAGTVIVHRMPAFRARPRRAQVLAAAIPCGLWMIKRVAAVAGDDVPEPMRARARAAVVPAGMVAVSADNPAGTDSRQLGLVPTSHVLGRVVCRLGSAGHDASGQFRSAADSGRR